MRARSTPPFGRPGCIPVTSWSNACEAAFVAPGAFFERCELAPERHGNATSQGYGPPSRDWCRHKWHRCRHEWHWHRAVEALGVVRAVLAIARHGEYEQ